MCKKLPGTQPGFCWGSIPVGEFSYFMQQIHKTVVMSQILTQNSPTPNPAPRSKPCYFPHSSRVPHEFTGDPSKNSNPGAPTGLRPKKVAILRKIPELEMWPQVFCIEAGRKTRRTVQGNVLKSSNPDSRQHPTPHISRDSVPTVTNY